MDFIIKRPSIADVKHAGPFPAAERVRHLGRETDVGGATQRGGGPIRGNIGKVALDPDIEFLTGVTMVGKGVIGWEVDEQLTPTFGEITAERRDLRAWGNALAFEGFPDNVLEINNRLFWSKGERLFVGGHDVSGEPVGHSRQEHAEADEERDALPEGASLSMHSASFRAEVMSGSLTQGHYTSSRT